MNINSLNVLTSLSGATGSEGLGSLLGTEGLGGKDFAEALMTEIGQLQTGGNQGSSPLPLQHLEQLPEGALQDIAALLGNKLPVAGKVDQNIDLEQTLAALKDVLQHVEAVAASTQETTAKVDPVLAQETDPEPVELQSTILPQETQLNKEIVDWTSAIAAEWNALLVASKKPHSDESKENILTVVSDESNDNDAALPVAGAMIPVVVETVDKPIPALVSGLVRAEGGGDAKKSTYELLQNLMQTGKVATKDDASVNGPVKISDVQVSVNNANPELLIEPSEKVESFEQKLFDFGGDKKLMDMAAAVSSLNKSGGVEQKPEIPAMTKPMTHPEWKQELGERIVWMNNKAVPFAELRLNPQHLGPISIRINMDQDQASIAFSAQHASVREAIEAAVPKLREMLGAQQLNLADVNISQSSTSDQGRYQGFGQMAQQQGEGGQKESNGNGAFAQGGHLAEIAEDIDSGQALVSNGLLSLFA